MNTNMESKSVYPPPGEHRINANIPVSLWTAFQALARSKKMTGTAALVALMTNAVRKQSL